MKRRHYILTMFLLCVAMGVLVALAGFWGAVFAEPQSPRVLVVYYSRDGHTHQVAEKIAAHFGADRERLIDMKDRVGPVAVVAAGKDAVAGNLTELEPLQHDPERYDIVLIGTPGWFGNVTPAVRTFLISYSLEGKTVGFFGTVHLTGIESALAQVSALAGVAQEDTPLLPLRHRDIKGDNFGELVDGFYRAVMTRYAADRTLQ